jgi:ribulose-5-phosphate 4-epimerase/fuculose-1-phosphate aldolase
MDEGYIKFKIHREDCDLDAFETQIQTLNECRGKLLKEKWIGVYPNGIGFGNVSIRTGKGKFLITASATGHLKSIGKEDVSEVFDYNFSKNELWCRGMKNASSESMTHAIIYDSAEEAQVVVHIHDIFYWEVAKSKLPSTSSKVAYGTPEMAYALQEIVLDSTIDRDKPIIMGGHEEGIIAYGKDFAEVLTNLEFYKKKYTND